MPLPAGSFGRVDADDWTPDEGRAPGWVLFGLGAAFMLGVTLIFRRRAAPSTVHLAGLGCGGGCSCGPCQRQQLR